MNTSFLIKRNYENQHEEVDAYKNKIKSNSFFLQKKINFFKLKLNN